MPKPLTLLLLGLLVFACSTGDGPVAGGDGDVTETGNAFVQGMVVTSLGLPAADVPVVLYKTSFNPVEDTVPDSLMDTTDVAGGFVFDAVPPDTYNVLARDAGLGMVMLVPAITAAGNETCSVPPDTLRRGRAVQIALDSVLAGPRCYLYVQGTDVYMHLDTMPVDSQVVLSSLPYADSLRIRYLYRGVGDTLLYLGLSTSGSSDTTSCPGVQCQRHEP